MVQFLSITLSLNGWKIFRILAGFEIILSVVHSSVCMSENAGIFYTMTPNFIHTYFSNSKTNRITSVAFCMQFNNMSNAEPMQIYKNLYGKCYSFRWHVLASGTIGLHNDHNLCVNRIMP
jgi:hypothetical protein